MLRREVRSFLELGRQHPQVPAVMGATCLMMLGHGVMTPVLPMFATSMGASATELGLCLSAFGVARLLLNVPVGLAAERWGRRPLLVAGPLLNAVGMLGCGFGSDSVEQLMAWRFVAGAGNSMYLGGAQIYLSDIASPETRGRILGANHSALLLGVSSGPALGGIVAEATGSLQAPFAIVGAGAAAAGLHAFARIPETLGRDNASVVAVIPAEDTSKVESSQHKDHGHPPPPNPSKLSGNGDAKIDLGNGGSIAKVLMRDGVFTSTLAANFSGFAMRQGGRNTLLALFVVDNFGYSVGDLGLCFAAMAAVDLAIVIPSAVASDMVFKATGDRRPLVCAGLVGSGLGLAAVSVTGRSTGPDSFSVAATPNDQISSTGANDVASVTDLASSAADMATAAAPDHGLFLAALTIWALSTAVQGTALQALSADAVASAIQPRSDKLTQQTEEHELNAGSDGGPIVPPTITTESEARSTGLSLFRTAGDVAFVFTPPLLGACADMFGVPCAMQVLAAATLCSAGVLGATVPCRTDLSTPASS